MKTIRHLLQCRSLLLARTIGRLLGGGASCALQWRRRRRGRDLREKTEKHMNSRNCVIVARLHFEKASMCVQTWLKERNTNVGDDEVRLRAERVCERACGSLMSRVKLVCPLWIIHNSGELSGHKQPGRNIKASVCSMLMIDYYSNNIGKNLLQLRQFMHFLQEMRSEPICEHELH